MDAFTLPDDLLLQPILSSQDFVEKMTENAEEDCELFELETIFDIMWDFNSKEMRRAGLTEESIFHLSAPENAKSKRIYENHQKKYIAYANSVFIDTANAPVPANGNDNI